MKVRAWLEQHQPGRRLLAGWLVVAENYKRVA